jgi:5-(carboxyamino)imidazole ribonucleotide mutase
LLCFAGRGYYAIVSSQAKSGSSGGQPLVAIMMGSKSDWEVLVSASDTLKSLGIAHEARVLSAHRSPDATVEYARGLAGRGVEVVITAAGLAAALPGVVAAMTELPVLGVPLVAGALNGVDALLAIVQMPPGIPVGTLAIGKPGAINAALFAAAILANKHSDIKAALLKYRREQTEKVLAIGDPSKS